jgi:hypothetical protein
MAGYFVRGASASGKRGPRIRSGGGWWPAAAIKRRLPSLPILPLLLMILFPSLLRPALSAWALCCAAPAGRSPAPSTGPAAARDLLRPGPLSAALWASPLAMRCRARADLLVLVDILCRCPWTFAGQGT